MSIPAAQLRAHEKRIAGMLADPELVGDLLLVGLVFARSLDLGDPPLETVVRHAGRMVYGNADHGSHLPIWRYTDDRPSVAINGWRRVKDVLWSDIRRYVPDLARAYRCQRPLVRRVQEPGAPVKVCGRSATSGGRDLFTDTVDGSRVALGACNQPRCKAWWQGLREANEREVAANRPPAPVANRGGVLERHLDEIDWPKIYQHLDPKWSPPHEAPGWRPPKLQVVITDDSDLEVVPRVRPALIVVEGGWR